MNFIIIVLLDHKKALQITEGQHLQEVDSNRIFLLHLTS